MKFIRDIISEKANLAGRTGRELPETDMDVDAMQDPAAESDQSNALPADMAGADVDIINKVASGGQSLNGGSEHTFVAEDSADPELGPEMQAAGSSDTPACDHSARVGDDSGFNDLPADAIASAFTAPQDEEDGDDPSELFGDLWADTTTDTPESDSDPVAKDESGPLEVETTANTPPSKPAPRPAPARPVTRAILTGDAPIPQPAQQEAAPEDSSPFQRVARRDRHMPSDMPPRRAQPASEIRDEMPAKPAVEPAAATPKTIKVPAPAAGRATRQAGRVKTRLLGFNTAQDSAPDPFDNPQSQKSGGSAQIPAQNSAMYPVGWMVVADGPGRGHAFSLFDGVSQIGRGEGQAIRLDFGDNSISRSSHAAIAYDGEQQAFFLGHGGKANLVRLNGNPVLSTEKLSNGAQIRIGETTLRFVALCGNEFDWGSCQDDDIENAQFG